MRTCGVLADFALGAAIGAGAMLPGLAISDATLDGGQRYAVNRGLRGMFAFGIPVWVLLSYLADGYQIRAVNHYNAQ
jgi:hypothetical protein